MSAPPHLPTRLLVAHAHPEAFAPMARAILARMGYRIVTRAELPSLPASLVARPDLLLVDERLLARLPAHELDPEGGAPVPIVLLTGRRGVRTRDPRIVGAVRKPAGMHELYRLIQQILEERPRTTLRVATQLSALCRRGEEEWPAAVLSLSENGCLVRIENPLPLGSRIELVIELPGGSTIATEAEAAYQLISDLGLVFHATPPSVRRSIVEFVTEELVAA